MANEKVTLLDLSFDTTAGLNGLEALIAKSVELAKTKDQLQKAMKEEKKTRVQRSIQRLLGLVLKW